MSAEVIATALAEHAWVGEVRRTPSGAFMVRPSVDAMTFGARPWGLVGEYLQNWTDLYDWAFRSADLDDPATADVAGLTSTGRRPAEREVREWIESVVDIVLESWPRGVLELGCGTGLVLRHLHGLIGSYVGADLSRYAVDRIRAEGLPHTQVVIAGAHGIGSQQVKRAMAETMGTERPDCVLINNVVHCFPGTQYLAAVLDDAIDVVEAGGRVILGDLRHLGLRDQHHRWLASGAPLESDRFFGEEELYVDPLLIAYFAGISRRRVKVSVRAKTMSGDTEIIRYRYDVVLFVDPADDHQALDEVCWEDLSGDRLEAVALLVEAGPVVVTGIPNMLLDPSSDGVTANALSGVLEGTGLVVAVALDDPTRLEVRPASGHVPRIQALPPQDEPLDQFVARRLPEVLRAYLAETFPRERLPEVDVDPKPGLVSR